MWIIVAAVIAYGIYDYTNYKRVKDRSNHAIEMVKYVATRLGIPEEDLPKLVKSKSLFDKIKKEI